MPIQPFLRLLFDKIEVCFLHIREGRYRGYEEFQQSIDDGISVCASLDPNKPEKIEYIPEDIRICISQPTIVTHLIHLCASPFSSDWNDSPRTRSLEMCVNKHSQS